MIHRRLLDWLYPPRCTLCSTPLRNGKHLCESCAKNLPRLPSNRCLTCADSFDGPAQNITRCPNCIDLNPAFDFATSALADSEDSLRLIHNFKLLRQPELGPDLAPFALEAYLRTPRLTHLPNPILVPVPLHPARLRERWFNQAAEITKPLSQLLNIPSQNLLLRSRPTPRQATLTRKQRQQNLRHAFHLANPDLDLSTHSIILIDDVLTTGHTAHACAQALRNANPRAIAVLTILRA